MPSTWICVLLCLTIVGCCGGEEERKINDIENVKEEILKENDHDDGEDGGSEEEKEKEHPYEGIKTIGGEIDSEHENEDRDRDTIGKGGTEQWQEERNEKVKKETANPFATKYLNKRSANERKQAEREKGNVAMQKGRGESLENEETNKGKFYTSEIDVKRHRKNTITEKEEMKKRRAVRGRRVSRKKETRREWTKRQRNSRKHEMRGFFKGNGQYQSYGNYKTGRVRKVKSKIRRIRRRRGRRSKGQRKRIWKTNGTRYYSKYGYENERYKGYKENQKHRGSKKRPIYGKWEHGGRRWKSSGNKWRGRVKYYSHSFENNVGRRRKVNGNRKKKIFRVNANGKKWRKRPTTLKKQRYRRNRKRIGKKHGYHVKRIKKYNTYRRTKVGERTKIRKITALNKKGNRKKFNKGRQKTKMQRYKEKKKIGSNYGNYIRKYHKYIINNKAKVRNRKIVRRKGYRKKINREKQKIEAYKYINKKKRKGGNHSRYFRKYNRHRVYKKVRFQSRNSFRRKRKGRFYNMKGKKGKSWCSLSRYGISAKRFKQIIHAFAYNQLRSMQNWCRRPEWYKKRFGAVRGYKKWIQCWQMQWEKSTRKTARYQRKRKSAKCGKQHYKPAKELCCRGYVYKKLNGTKCCGKYVYNMTSQFCWNNTIFNSSTHSLCNSVVYNHMERFCHNGSLYDKNGRLGICCEHLYDRMSRLCYKCKTYLRCCYSRCGSEVYYVKYKFCYHGCLFDRKLYDVCGGRVISRSKYKCVNKVITPRTLRDVASRKRELHGNGEYGTGKKIKMVGKRSFSCQEMIHN